ncbi:MAG: hypothetical protein WD050_03100 [Actinomycetota bacterium]
MAEGPPGWFIELEKVPAELAGFAVRHVATNEPGTDGLLVIEDQPTED